MMAAVGAPDDAIAPEPVVAAGATTAASGGPLTEQHIRTARDVQNLLDAYDNWLIDCDGVLWQGSDLLPGTKEALDRLRAAGKRLLFVTNNSTKSRAQCLKKFQTFGLLAHRDEIVTSSYCAAQLLKHQYPDVKKVYVVGASGIVHEMQEHGIEVVGGDEPAEQHPSSMTEEEFGTVSIDEGVAGVVCGWDMHFTFRKLCKASLYLQQPGVVFVATNMDAADNIKGRMMPANGAVIAALSTATGKQPVVAGKPAAWIAQMLFEHMGLDKSRSIMIGDNMSTDIALATNAAFASALVYTGVAKVGDLDRVPPKDKPTFILHEFGRLGLTDSRL